PCEERFLLRIGFTGASCGCGAGAARLRGGGGAVPGACGRSATAGSGEWFGRRFASSLSAGNRRFPACNQNASRSDHITGELRSPERLALLAEEGRTSGATGVSGASEGFCGAVRLGRAVVSVRTK